jgi:cell division protease FtsH
MVCEWGMSEKMGMVEYGEHEDYVFLGRDISRARDYSEATAEQIDREVRRLIDDAYQTGEAHAHRQSRHTRTIAKRCSSTRPSTARRSKKSSSTAADQSATRHRPAGPSKKMAPEKPPKQVVVAPDVTPPLPGALGGARLRGLLECNHILTEGASKSLFSLAPRFTTAASPLLPRAFQK